jgi:hypothetical protein
MQSIMLSEPAGNLAHTALMLSFSSLLVFQSLSVDLLLISVCLLLI